MWRLFCCNRLMPWSRTRPVIKKDFGDCRGKAFDENAGDKPHQDQFRIPLKHADARFERRKVKPVRWSFRILEESSQGSRSAFKGLLIPIHPRLDESSLLLRGQQEEVVRQLFGQRVSDNCVLDVFGRDLRRDHAGFLIARPMLERYIHRCFHEDCALQAAILQPCIVLGTRIARWNYTPHPPTEQ